jgi:flavodoxin
LCIILWKAIRKDTAEKIAAILHADVLRLEPVKEYPAFGPMKYIVGGKAAVFGEAPELRPYTVNFLSYDAVIAGTPVWASTFAPALRTFFAKHKVENQRVGIFACEKGSGGDKCIDKLQHLMGADRLNAQMILIDPKEHPAAENEQAIADFCAKMQK